MLPLYAAAQTPDDSTRGYVHISPAVGFAYGIPLKFSVSAGGLFDFRGPHNDGVIAMGEMGQGGGEVSIGYFRMMRFGQGFDVASQGSARARSAQRRARDDVSGRRGARDVPARSRGTHRLVPPREPVLRRQHVRQRRFLPRVDRALDVRDIDWPLAITLAVVFVVMSVVRWRYFRSVARRRARRPEDDDTPR